MSELEEFIAEAEAAREKLREIEDLQEQAAELPYLLADRQLNRDRQEDRRQLVNAEKRARAIMGETIRKAVIWTARFDAITEELSELIASVAEVEDGIHAAARVISAAAYNRRELEGPPKDYGQGQTGLEQAMPAEMAELPYGIAAMWERAGGRDPALNLLPTQPQNGSLSAEIAKVIRRRCGSGIYSPVTGANRILRR